MSRLLLIPICFALHPAASAQDRPALCFRPLPDSSSRDFEIRSFRFYISAITLYNNGVATWTEENSYHLVDAADARSLQISLANQVMAFDSLSFILGIDSATNCSGVMGGDLDPTKGMYWTWQSGYINLKLEGSRLVAGQHREFSLHLGGYRQPYPTAQYLGYRVKPGAGSIVVECDAGRLIGAAGPASEPRVMSPGAEAAFFSGQAAAMFRILP